MDKVRVFRVDAFTSRRFSGNPAAVVLDADEMSGADMRLLARELGSADTAFVLRADGADHDLRVRFLTPRGEAPFIGHATLAVHAALASIGSPPRPRQKQANGIVRVEAIPDSCGPRFAIHQPPPQLRELIDAAALPRLLQTLSLSQADLDPRCPPQLAGMSGTRLLLGLRDADTLAGVRPDLNGLAQLSPQLGAPGVFLFTLQPKLPQVLTEARMFCPALGIEEDPVSGNAHALLGTYLLHLGLLPAPVSASIDEPESIRSFEFTGAQGHHMERPGQVTVALTVRGAELIDVAISGAAAVVFCATVDV